MALYGPLCRSVDLGHPLDSAAVFWPGNEGLCLCVRTSGASPPDGGPNTFYAAGTFSCAEHGGTHVDAPFHFYEHGVTVEKLTLEQLVAPARVVATANGQNVTETALLAHEAAFGPIPSGCIVLCHTGWGEARYAQGAAAYLGWDEKTQGPYDPAVSSLAFPGLTPGAAALLVSRRVAAVGLDTASLDPGACKGFDAHRALLSAGVYGIENLVSAELARLPARGVTVMVMPIKLAGGTGAPARVVAFLPPPGWKTAR